MPTSRSLALVGDDERHLTLLSWQLMSEQAEVGSRLLFTPELLSQRARWGAELRQVIKARAALVTYLSRREALELSLKVAREVGVPVIVCSPEPSLEEATLCLRGGAREYLDQPWRMKVNLTAHILSVIDTAQRVKPEEQPASQAAPDEVKLELQSSKRDLQEQASLIELIDTSLTFQEALTPIEDELRRLYLTALIREESSMNGAARRAGVDRSNFKRLLKRYGVTREGEPS